MQHLHEWISALQVHRSHYTRAEAPMRQYMDQHWSVPMLYNLYFNDMDQNRKPFVSRTKFQQVFKEDYNIDPR